MNTTLASSQPPILKDPRSRPDFVEKYYPLANGKPAPARDSQERNDLIMLDLLAAYYDLNCAHSKLLQMRRSTASDVRSEAERRYLPEVDQLLIIRDELEDRYAPCGVLAQPVVKDGFTINIKFSFGNVDSRGKRRNDLFRATLRVPVPLPPGAKLTDYILDFQGPEQFTPLTS